MNPSQKRLHTAVNLAIRISLLNKAINQSSKVPTRFKENPGKKDPFLGFHPSNPGIFHNWRHKCVITPWSHTLTMNSISTQKVNNLDCPSYIILNFGLFCYFKFHGNTTRCSNHQTDSE